MEEVKCFLIIGIAGGAQAGLTGSVVGRTDFD